MHRLFPEKLVTIITTDVLENILVSTVRRRGVSGYTIVRAHGAGSGGVQSGMLWTDTNIKFHVIIPPDRLSGLLDDLEQLNHKGHHLTVCVSDVSVLGPEKYETSMD